MADRDLKFDAINPAFDGTSQLFFKYSALGGAHLLS